MVKHNFSVKTVQERFDSTNTDKLLSENLNQNTVLINCIAIGVTFNPFISNYQFENNIKLHKKIIDNFYKSQSKKLIYFSSIFENTNSLSVPPDRSNYLNYKIACSKQYEKYLKKDERFYRIHLPNILADNQPAGRFFYDLVYSAKKGTPFSIKHPKMPLIVITIDTFLENFFTIVFSEGGGNYNIAEEESFSNIEFVNFVNMLLEDNNHQKIDVKVPQSYNLDSKFFDSKRVSKNFSNQVSNYINIIFNS